MVMRMGVLAGILSALLAGCTDLTEFEGTYEAGVHIVQTPSLEVRETITGIPGARSLCPVYGSFFVATTQGTVHEYDLQTLEQLGSADVDFASAAGFSDMVHSPMEGTVYLIGSLGKIVEIRVSDLEVMDTFSVCESPVDLLMAADQEPFLYIADTATERILEIRMETNKVSRYCQMKSAPVCMAEDHRPDTMFAVMTASADLLSTRGAGIIRRRTLESDVPFLTVADMPEDTVICGVMRFPDADRVVTIQRYFPPFPEDSPDFDIWTGARSIDGDVHLICPGTDRTHAYVLSYIGNSVSRLSSYNYLTFQIDGQLDLNGYPMDLRIMSTGELLALTTD